MTSSNKVVGTQTHVAGGAYHSRGSPGVFSRSKGRTAYTFTTQDVGANGFDAIGSMPNTRQVWTGNYTLAGR